MGKKKRKLVRYFLPVILLLVGGLLLLNLQLTKRLEKYLKKELIVRTTDATDGFYRLSFDNLSISFFRGELTIEGIRLAPDPAVFRAWMQKDSLPSTYVTAHIGMIDFKGLNLTWRWSYKQLHFNSFEIRKPDIRAYNSYYSSRTEKIIRQAETKTLYEIISPYIDVLSVKTLNLEQASVSYEVVNPFSPILYALDNASFHAYGFRLDENSSESGKLLYCDNFDFATNQPQRLLTNNDFLLQTDSIRLSTKDSMVYISGISLRPQSELWQEKRQRPDSYLEARVEAVEVKGIAFEREKGLNYVTARSFDILSPDFSLSDFTHANNSKSTPAVRQVNRMETDSLVKSLSLYQIISPVLHSVSIRSIGIGQAKMQYSFALKDSVEVYKLAGFNFLANDFLVDSLSEAEHGFWYSRSFAFEASGIEGLLTARNHRVNIARMALNTETGDFSIEKVRLRPLSYRTRNDYMSGNVDTIRIRGLQYDNGISATDFRIDNPSLRYVLAAAEGKSSADTLSVAGSRVDVEGILNPFLRYLSVKRINLKNANVVLDDRQAPEPVVYSLKHFNFFATDILMNEQTGRGNGWFFDYGNMGFSFSRFDNYLPGKKYRVQVEKGKFSTVKGILDLQQVDVIPEDTAVQQASDAYFRVAVPSVRLTGLKHLPENPAKNLRFSSLLVDRPDVRMRKGDRMDLSFSLQKFEVDTIVWDSTLLRLGSIGLHRPVVSFFAGSRSGISASSPKTITPDSIEAQLYQSLSTISGRIYLNRLNISDAVMDYTFRGKDDVWQHQKLDTTDLVLEGLQVDNINRTFKLDDIRFSTRNLAFPLDNGFYTLKIGQVGWANSDLRVDSIHLVSLYPKSEFAYMQPRHQDWFDVRVGSLALSGIDLPGYFRDSILRIKDVQVSDALLQNFKNQQIAVRRHLVPMIYSGLQKAPVKLAIDRVGVNNLSVIYEELARKGTTPGKLFFTDMNGLFTGFTNVVSSPRQYIRLEADGKLMGRGYFTATWMLPVDSLNDLFLLNARMTDFDLTALNELITPLAAASIQSGHLNELTFRTEASSKGAFVTMRFLYSDLHAALLKEKDGELVDKKLLTSLVNRVLKRNNPDKTKRGLNNPRVSDVSIQRDPYHSTFNYLWQILRPAVIESVGISKKEQDTAQSVMTFFAKVKNFFRVKKKSQEEKLPAVEDADPLLLDFEPVNK